MISIGSKHGNDGREIRNMNSLRKGLVFFLTIYADQPMLSRAGNLAKLGTSKYHYGQCSYDRPFWGKLEIVLKRVHCWLQTLNRYSNVHIQPYMPVHVLHGTLIKV